MRPNSYPDAPTVLGQRPKEPPSCGSFAGPKGLVPLPYSEMGPTIEAINQERIMTLKNAIAAVLKAIRKARGLSQNNLAEVSSRTYVSKLERGQSSPTLEMMSTLSSPLGLSPLALVTLTLATETRESIRSLIKTAESELIALKEAGVFNELQIELGEHEPLARTTISAKSRAPAKASQQTEFCFAD